MVIGADSSPLGVNPSQLLTGADIVRTKSMPLDRADEAYQKMLAGKARFRMVLTVG